MACACALAALKLFLKEWPDASQLAKIVVSKSPPPAIPLVRFLKAISSKVSVTNKTIMNAVIDMVNASN